jgi:hypothetical protein
VEPLKAILFSVDDHGVVDGKGQDHGRHHEDALREDADAEAPRRLKKYRGFRMAE